MKYPSDVDRGATHEEDEKEFFKRVTDRDLFETRDLVSYVNGEFVLKNLPSDEMTDEIRKKLTLEEEAEFDRDMRMLRSIRRMPVKSDIFGRKPRVIDPDLYERGAVEM